MTFIVKAFDSYQIKYLSVTNSSGVCYNVNQFVGVLWFVDTYPIPRQNSLSKDGIVIYYHISHFNDIICILRYEKPLRLEFDTDKLEGSVVTSTYEPVEEEE
jgi:hypothetical protein